MAKFIIFRVFIVFCVVFLAFLIPNINILLTIGGSALGTIVNIIIPVMFYNRAFTNSKKNLGLENQ